MALAPRAHHDRRMNTTTTIAFLVAVVGALLYFATQGKPSQAGLVAFGCGLLAALLALGMHPIHF